jgi:hypothetical protein
VSESNKLTLNLEQSLGLVNREAAAREARILGALSAARILLADQPVDESYRDTLRELAADILGNIE